MADSYILREPEALIPELAISLFKESDTWRALLEAFDNMLQINVDAPLRELEKIRYLDPDSDKEIIKNTVRLLGFDVTQDVLNLNNENLTKIVTQIPMYPDHNSSVLFKNFIDVLLGGVTEIEYLYTKDYLNFYPTPGGSMITEGGRWFKTTHINVGISLDQLSLLGVTDGELLFKKVLNIFYTFTPIALVIKHFYFIISIKDEQWLGGKAFGFGIRLFDAEEEITLTN
jgi:hypothetical protein